MRGLVRSFCTSVNISARFFDFSFTVVFLICSTSLSSPSSMISSLSSITLSLTIPALKISPTVFAFTSTLNGIVLIILPMIVFAKGIAVTRYCVPAVVTSNCMSVILIGMYFGMLGATTGVPFSS